MAGQPARKRLPGINAAAGRTNRAYQELRRGWLGQILGIRPIPPQSFRVAVAGMKDNSDAAFLEHLRGGKNTLVAQIRISRQLKISGSSR
jgi:hypothetical protein